MENFILNAQPRAIVGKKVKKLRHQGKLPVVLYGRGIEPQNLEVDNKEFAQVFSKAGASSLVNLKIADNKPLKVLIHEPQRNPISNQLVHADIYQVKMTEKIRTEIPLHFIGEAPAVTELEGNLITNRDSLEVECLPDALVSAIEVDLSQLKSFDDVIHIKDISIPENIEVLNDVEESIALVTQPRSEAELEEELATPTAEEEKAAVEQLEESSATPEGEQKTEE